MPIREIQLLTNNYYHIYNPGNNRQDIFFEADNYLYFLKKLRAIFNNEVQVISYCLMPNHYHLLVYLQTDDFSRIMQKFSIAYTKAINKRFNRVGALFQGQFKAINVKTDEYLLHLSRYIHLNPVRANLVKSAQDWQFSSYLDYIGLRQGTLPHYQKILDYFPSREAYQIFCESYQPQDVKLIKDLIF